MSIRTILGYTLIALAGCAVVAAAFIFPHVRTLEHGIAIGQWIAISTAPQQAALVSAPPAPKAPERVIGWREGFEAGTGDGTIPDTWKLVRKPGTKSAVFSVGRDPDGTNSYLHMEADRASASVITRCDNVDLARTPVLRWRWRATALPEGADARSRSLDDQAIGIYVGTGSQLSNKSVAYHWDTETPRGSEGSAAYGLGGIRVKWFTVRNKEDGTGSWITEERNVAEDFRKAWGFVPDKVFITVSCNSQYTGTEASADLDSVEFVSL